MATDQATSASPITAVDAAVATILATPPLPAVSQVPSLPGDVAALKTDAAAWTDGIRAQVVAHATAAGAAAATFTNTTTPALHDAIVRAMNGDASAATTVETTLSGGQQAALSLEEDAKGAIVAARQFNDNMAVHAVQLTADSTAAAAVISAGDRQLQSLHDTVKRLQAAQQLNRVISELGFALDGSDKAVLDTIDQLLGLQTQSMNEVKALQGEVSSTQAQVTVVTACASSLAVLLSADDHLLTSLTALPQAFQTIAERFAAALQWTHGADVSYLAYIAVEMIAHRYGGIATTANALLDGVKA